MSETEGPSRLSAVRYRLSAQTAAQRDAVVALLDLLARDPVSDRGTETRRVSLRPTTPGHADPKTVLEAVDGASRLTVEGDIEIERIVEGIPFFDAEEPESNQRAGRRIQHEDSAGQYVEVPRSGGVSDYGIEIAELGERVADTPVTVDHTGISIPRMSVNRSTWERLNAEFAALSCLYSYPTGEPWNFILPATDTEIDRGIERFVRGRRPRFELVFDAVADSPVIQLALRTDLSRADVESRFPRPYGFSPDGVADVFRVVSVVHPWSAFSISFHLYFGDVARDWKTGEWLVTEGTRITPSN